MPDPFVIRRVRACTEQRHQFAHRMGQFKVLRTARLLSWATIPTVSTECTNIRKMLVAPPSRVRKGYFLFAIELTGFA